MSFIWYTFCPSWWFWGCHYISIANWLKSSSVHPHQKNEKIVSPRKKNIKKTCTPMTAFICSLVLRKFCVSYGIINHKMKAEKLLKKKKSWKILVGRNRRNKSAICLVYYLLHVAVHRSLKERDNQMWKSILEFRIEHPMVPMVLFKDRYRCVPIKRAGPNKRRAGCKMCKDWINVQGQINMQRVKLLNLYN